MRKVEERDKLNPCPICGSYDKMYISDEVTFEELKEEKNCITVHVECYRCGLGVYSHHGNEAKDTSYGAHRAVTRERWNKLGHKKAHWVGTEYDGYADGFPVYDKWECSACGHEITSPAYEGGLYLPDYCSECGAEMEAFDVQEDV